MNSKKTFWVTWVITLSMATTAFVLLRLGFINYGITLFCILPACIGLLTGVLPRKTFAIWGMIAAVSIFILILWGGQLEGIVCILMALPVVAVFVFIGYIIAAIIKKLTRKKDNVTITLLPLLLFLTAIITEYFWKGDDAYAEVTTSLYLPHSPQVIYDHIKHVDTVIAPPNWLHQLGLPYPRKCVLTSENIGGLRICVFDEGDIIERITALKKNELLKMEITAYNLPGQSWFSFEEDIYRIASNGEGGIITRTTTYTSRLKPRLYWKFVEKITIGAEQELVFENLKNELSEKSY